MHRHRHGLEPGTGQHHDRPALRVEVPFCEFGKKLGMPGKRKSGRVQCGFGDRVGDDSAGKSIGGQRYGPLDGFYNRWRIFRVRSTGVGKNGIVDRQDRQTVTACRCLLDIADFHKRCADAEFFRPLRKHGRAGNRCKRRKIQRLSPAPHLQGNVRADPRRIAHCQSEGSGIAGLGHGWNFQRVTCK